MKLPLQIVFRDIVPLPSLEPEIRRLAAKLDQWTPDVMSCHVAVEATGKDRARDDRGRGRIGSKAPLATRADSR